MLSEKGGLKWIEPSTENIIIKNSKLKNIIIMILLSEHSETLVELDIEYKELAKKMDAKTIMRVSALGINKDFILGLAGLIKKQSESSLLNERICPSNCNKCFLMKRFNYDFLFNI